MKKILFKTLLAGLVLFSFASCSNEDDPTIDFVEGTDTALVTGYEPGKFTIPVLGKGEWEATVVPEDADWIALPQTKGEGSGQVVFLVEANTTEELRKAQIVLKAGKKTLTYDVTQTTLVEEEVDDKSIVVAISVLSTLAFNSVSTSAILLLVFCELQVLFSTVSLSEI